MTQPKQNLKADNLSLKEKIIELENQIKNLKIQVASCRKNKKVLADWINKNDWPYRDYKARMEKRFQERCFEENWIIKNHSAIIDLLLNSTGLLNRAIIKQDSRNLWPDIFKGIDANLMEMNKSLSFIKKSIEDHDETNQLSMYCMNASLKKLN